MKVAFRVDASLRIGTGHVMRELTLAQALRAHGVESHFLCRNHEGHLIGEIRAQGYAAHTLPAPVVAAKVPSQVTTQNSHVSHKDWLGTTQSADAEACRPILDTLKPDWLVVDHYALDAQWEHMTADHCGAIVVVDDLADRQHTCKLLLDQTFARESSDYLGKVPPDCTILCGSQYALLRPEFTALRSTSLKRRTAPVLRELLISMGGIDEHNVTSDILSALTFSSLPLDCRITVVMGSAAPWLEHIRKQARTMPWQTRVLVSVSDMAQLMYVSDLAIGALGTTTWERCTMGLPTGAVILAENQRLAARLLQQAEAIRLLEGGHKLRESVTDFIREMSDDKNKMAELGHKASLISDGRGCERVLAHLLKKDPP
jgi:UDP-2,4-diacetamido-2,4,6-trideoxy-beta-L-altropyranose hydrolase